MRSVLVTGATGFIGRPLCERLVEEGCRVKGTLRNEHDLMRLPSGVEPAVVGQVDADTDWTAALEGIDAVVHLAARVHVMREQTPAPLAAFRRVNVAGTERLARAAVDMGVKRFVFMSSIGVNGNRTIDRPFKEDDEPDPQTPYSVSKFEAENALQRIGECSAMEWIIIRPPLVYGPGNPGNILSLFRLVARRVPLPFASVNNSRSFIGVSNLVDAVYRCVSIKSAANGIYAVSDGEDISTPEFIKRIGVSLGIPARLFPFPVLLLKILGSLTGNRAKGHQLLGSLTIDIGKMRNEMNWTPPCMMEDELRKTAQWYKVKHQGTH